VGTFVFLSEILRFRNEMSAKLHAMFNPGDQQKELVHEEYEGLNLGTDPN